MHVWLVVENLAQNPRTQVIIVGSTRAVSTAHKTVVEDSFTKALVADRFGPNIK